MGWFSKLIGADTVAAPIEALGNVFDKLFTSDEERAQAEFVMERLRQRPGELQVMVNMMEAQHRSVFVAGWRPFIGWVCGFGVAWAFLIHPVFEWVCAMWFPETKAPGVHTDILFELVLAMLGMAGLRTAEKFKGRSK